MNSKLSRMFNSIGGSGWWIIILFFLFLAFQECFIDICLNDWIPFLILLLIVCSCDNNLESDCSCCQKQCYEC